MVDAEIRHAQARMVVCEVREGNMSPIGGATAARSLLALALGTGVCYCVYKVLSTRGKQRRASILDRVVGMSVLAQWRTPEPPSENIPKSAGDLEPHHLKSLLQILSTNSDSSAQEQILTTLCNAAAFSVNHDIIRNLDGIRIIGALLSHTDTKLKAGTLNALNNLSMNLQNQEQIQAFINEIFKDILESELNSEVQLAGLRLVINMSVTNNYHEKMADYIPNLLNLMDGGDATTKIYLLKVLVNLSANPLMTSSLLTSKAPSAVTFLFDSSINRDILIRALTFAANVSENLGRQQQWNRNCNYKEDSLYALLFKDQASLQSNLAPLLLIPDLGIKQQVSRCLRSSERL
ncbi:armadillo repeat-containing protein 10 [Engystomops pustulosus]|uniref:armadillo repeat-containing protein 10 n=1 Tax=Engystomops pustulosus TaxID=76066 RepID=UPI003AFA5776